MADPDRNSPTGTAQANQGAQSSVIALFLLVATAAGVLNLPTSKSGASAQGADSTRSPIVSSASSGPPTKADYGDALEALEPLLRFLNLTTQPASLPEFAEGLKGYRITTMIATLADPTESRLGYDFDMSLEAIQRAIESEGYTLDRFRLPWVDDSPSSISAPVPVATQAKPPVAGAPKSKPAPTKPASPPANDVAKSRGMRYERQPGTILYRIDRQPGSPNEPVPPQELLLLMIVGETPTWGVQHEALQTSLNIAWHLDYRLNRKSAGTDRESAIRILGPTFSGTADSLARAIKAWTEQDAKRKDARIWICSGAATAVNKVAIERLCLPAKVVYSSSVIPDEILLRAVYRYLASPSSRTANREGPTTPEGTIALLVEGGSGYGSAVGRGYGTNSAGDDQRRIISIPFPSQINQIRMGQANQDSSTKNRVSIPLDPPAGKMSDHIPSLSPKMTVATDSLILSDILGTISIEEVRYVGIVATDILDVMFLTKLIRDNCPDVQIFLIGNDLRYTDPQFTLDFRGTVIASSYPLDSRAQVWAFPFRGDSVRRLFASEYDVGRYNAGLVLLNAQPDPENEHRLIVEPDQAEDFIAYGKPFAATAFDTFNRRPQIWINQVGQDDLWPLKVIPISQLGPDNRKLAEDLIPTVVSLDPQQDRKPDYRINYDFPLGWKLIMVGMSLVGLGLVGLILYSNRPQIQAGARRSSWFTSAMRPLKVLQNASVERHWFYLAALDLAVLIPYCGMIAPLDLLLSSRGMEGGEGADLASLILEPHLYLLAILSWFTLFALLIPPLKAAWVIRGGFGSPGSMSVVTGPPSGDWSVLFERVGYRILILMVALTALGCVSNRVYRFAFARFELPNDWLVSERGVHLFSGVSPIIPVLFLGAAFAWWVHLELQRFHSHPLLRRGENLLDIQGSVPSEFRSWVKVVAEMNARFRHTVRLLDDPLTGLISNNPPLAGLFGTASAAIAVFVVGVIWPRYIATPDGPVFDAFFMLGFTAYLMIQLYSLVRFVWLWRSVNQLFGQLAVLPLTTVYDRLPPIVGQIFGRFLSAMPLTAEDLKLPSQQIRLLMHPKCDSDFPEMSRRVQEAAQPLIQAGASSTDILEAASRVCVPAVLERNWEQRTLEDAYGTQRDDAAKPAGAEEGQEAEPAAEIAARRWLAMAEELVALRIVYLVSQFSAPLKILARQLIFGPLILLLAATWYPFQPQRLIAMITWGFAIVGALATFLVFVKIERNEFVNRVSRTATNSFFFDKTFLTNLAPYAVTVIGFLFTAFPSLSYWLGSVIEPLSRAVK